MSTIDTAQLKKLVAENYDFLVQTRRHFHQHPELSSQEYETAKHIIKHLEAWGIPYETAGVSDIVATITGENPGKTIALRGDIDALPILEATGLPFASEASGIMHACGHDFHGTYMLGVAKILKDLKATIHGTVKIIFQEGEEIGAGAKKLMATPILNGVDNIIGLHVSAGEDLGKFTFNYGVMSSHGGGVFIDITSKGGSLSEPEAGSNAVLAGVDIISELTSLTTQQISGRNQVTLVPTIFKAEKAGEGGIPSKAHIEINFRTLDLADSKRLDDIADAVVNGIKMTHNVDIQIVHRKPGTAVNNDKASCDRAARIITDLYGKDAVIWTKPSMGGEDFSRYQEKIPGVFVHVGAISDGNYRAHHTDKTDFDERVLTYGLEFALSYVFDYLNEK